MARRPSYGFQKQQTELRKQKKRDEKQEKKRLKEEPVDAVAPTEPKPTEERP